MICYDQIVSEDHLDPNALQIEKEQAKTVNFTTEDEIIPVSEDEDTDHEDLDETEAADKADEGVGGHAVVEARAVDVISGEGVVTNSKASSGILSVRIHSILCILFIISIWLNQNPIQSDISVTELVQMSMHYITRQCKVDCF